MSDLFDQAKNLAGQHPDQANQVLDQAAEQVKQRTGGQFDSQIDQARQAAGQQFGLGAEQTPAQAPADQAAAPAEPAAAPADPAAAPTEPAPEQPAQ